MKRLAQVIPTEPIVPEFSFVVFTKKGAIVYNGQVGIRYSLKKLGPRISNLVEQYGNFAILDGLKFFKVTAALEKISSAVIDREASVLRIESSEGKTKVAIPITLKISPDIQHLQINWDTLDGMHVKVENIWQDAIDLISNEGQSLWGDVIGIYDDNRFSASFDYGVLLYHGKSRRSKGTTYFCPKDLLNLGIQDVSEAIFTENGVFIVGDEVQYYTSAAVVTTILDQMLLLRDNIVPDKEKAVTMDFSTGLWKRAKIFNKLVLTMVIHNGIITLSGNDWSEIIGKTAAPNGKFITRISLLQRWTTGTLGHKIYISDSGSWTLYGKTRNGSEFLGNLSEIPKSRHGSPEISVDDIDENIPDIEIKGNLL